MKRILCITAILLVICLTFTVVSTSAKTKSEYEFINEVISDVDTTYESEIMPHFYPERFEGKTNIWFYYNMLYAHNTDSLSEPEYIVFIAWTGIGEPASIYKYFGDYYVFSYSMDFPYDLGYYVYIPSQQKVYTLEDAWNCKELDISAAFQSGRIGIHRGDVNLDRSFDILDATYIQLHLAKVDGFEQNSRMDFDFDNVVSILDATAIQLKLAKLDVQ